MLYRIEAGLFPHLDDTIGRKTAASIREALGIPVKSVRTIKVFTLEGLDAQQVNSSWRKACCTIRCCRPYPCLPCPARRRHIVDH